MSLVTVLQNLELDRRRPELLYMQLVNGLKRMISAGRIPTGAQLPSGREIAALLSVNRSTVRKALDELLKQGYVQHHSAHRLAAHNPAPAVKGEPFPNIGVLLPDKFSRLLEMPYVMSYFKGIIDETCKRHISLLLITLPELEASPAELREFNRMLSQRLLGVIHLGGRNNQGLDRPLISILDNVSLTQVMISAYPWHNGHVGVATFDAGPGARSVANQLRVLKHREVVLCLSGTSLDDNGPERGFTYASMKRAREVQKVFLEYNLQCEEKSCLYGCVSFSATLEKLRQRHEAGQMPTAFWCSGDEIAFWVIDALHRLGYEVPRDVSVIGFDGTPPPAEMDDVLTTVALPFYEIGKSSVIQLLDIHDNGMNENNREVKVATQMIWKKSLGKANGK